MGKHLARVALTPQDWHLRYTQQACWTQDLRRFLFERAGLKYARRVLDVGCGTGALITDLLNPPETVVLGLDVNPVNLNLAARSFPQAIFTQGDAHNLPFPNNWSDVCLCHFLLLWVTNPVKVVSEMRRVTRPGGAVLVLAEPDYGGRIDYPEQLTQLGVWQQNALRILGAEPRMGRQLAAVIRQAGLIDVETGVLGGQWSAPPSAEDLRAEWRVLQDDLGDTIPQDTLEKLYQLDQTASVKGERILFVPTFYAWGRVP